MQQEVFFLNTIKKLARNIENDSEQVVNELAICLSEHPALIIDHESTINMLNALTSVMESNFAQAELRLLQQALWHYWLMLFHCKKMDVFFIGSEGHAAFFYQYADKNHIENFYFIKGASDEPVSAEAFSAQLSVSERPVIIYDREAENILTLPQIQTALSVAAFQEVMFNKAAPFSLKEDSFIAYMQEKHQRFLDTSATTLIVGNSYGYHAFPQQDLHQAVNLSMHSMDLKQAHAMVHHYTQQEGVKEIVMMFGLFDLFYELAKTRTEENVRVVHILSHYNHHNQIIPHTKTSLPVFERDEAALAAEMIPFNMATPELQHFNQRLARPEMLANHCEFWEEKKQHKTSLNEETVQANSAARAALHSKNYKYSLSLRINKRWLAEVAARVEQRGVKLHYVIPPFPAAYRQHLHPAMVQENEDFLRTLQSDNFILHDFSAHSAFTCSDFLDGDHMNSAGAAKLNHLLREAGVAL